jgi:hypothetical protein
MRSLIKAIFRVFLVIAFFQTIWILINFVSRLYTPGNIYGNFESTDKLQSLGIAAGIFIVVTIALVLLWRKTDTIIKMVAGNISDNEIVINTTNSELYRIIMRVLGIIIIVTNVPSFLVTLGYNFLYIKIINDVPYEISASGIITELLIRGISILLGIWLIIGNKSIVNAKNNIMNWIDADNKDEQQETDNEKES